jgi:aminoglycoside 3-N-acetyltransferase
MPWVTQQDIRQGLLRLGLKGGDTVLMHSSLSSFGWVEGSASAVVEALLQVLKEGGTLIAPTFSYYLQGDEKVWDREHTPSRMGVISETVRTWPGALRSNHAAHPLAAIGLHAPLICRRPHKTGFGPDSPFFTLVELGAFILLMGVGYNSCTFFHLLEAKVEVPYRYLEERKATVIIDGVRDEHGSAWEYTRRPGARNDFVPLGRALEERQMVRQTRVGDSELRLFRAADAYQVGLEIMGQDPLFLLTQESRADWQ